MTRGTKRSLIPLSAAVLLLISGFALTIATHPSEAAAPSAETEESVLPIDVDGAFELTAHDSRRVSDGDFRGLYMLVFFGYTWCPDVCPTELSLMAETMDYLGADAEKVQPLFITMDPVRDDAPTLASYVGNFHPRLIGLTGSEQEIDAVADQYGVIRQKVAGEDGGYMFSHTANTFVFGPDGEFIGTLASLSPPSAAAEAIREVVADSPVVPDPPLD